jgi:hypothetical protein
MVYNKVEINGWPMGIDYGVGIERCALFWWKVVDGLLVYKLTGSV